MAVRPVFYRIEQAPFYNTEETEFEYYGGFSLQQKNAVSKAFILHT